MSELRYININEIYPHPDNPRKNVGDVTELAESIKANGILQNLTVISIAIPSKVLAIAKVAEMETHNSITKDELVGALRWLFRHYEF